MSTLLLARHAETATNQAGIMTGNLDVGLSCAGREQAINMGRKLAGITIDAVLTSELQRTKQTAELALGTLPLAHTIPVSAHAELNERDYGSYTGRLAQDVIDEKGLDLFRHIRQSWDFPLEDTETLKEVHRRVAPFHHSIVLPALRGGLNILVVSSNHALRTYIKELEHLSINKVEQLEILNGQVQIYDCDRYGNISPTLFE